LELFGAQHQLLLNWLTGDWWQKGPPVAIVHGFPGIGKTEIAMRAMDSLRTTRSLVPIIRFNCPQTLTGSDDFLLTIAEECAAVGDTELIQKLELGEDTNAIFRKMLVPERLIVLDEAQRLLVGSTGRISSAMASLMERWSSTPDAKGRLLLVSNREFDYDRWNERAKPISLYPLRPHEAKTFLLSELKESSLVDAVPVQRYSDVVTWLGCNPRAIRLLVRALVRENLDDLIGLAPDAWDMRDRVVSPQLLHEFEKAVLERAEDRLDPEAQLFLRRLSVFRLPLDRRALQALSPNDLSLARLRDELIARFMMEFRGNHYDMHPVLRDTIRLRMVGAERRRAHLAAGNYYAAAFRARRMVGEAEKLGARFIEARYHFTKAESERDLAEISQRFEAHFRVQFQANSPVPANPEERNERIALLSALLQARGARGLEEHLARCLVARNQPGDIERALPHARRATGPQASVATWILRVRLENEMFGSTQALKVANEAIDAVRYQPNLGDIFYVVAEIAAGEGKPNEAIELMVRGIKETPVGHGRSALQRGLGKLFATEGKVAEGLEILSQAIEETSPGQNRSELQLAAAEVLAGAGEVDKAIELLNLASENAPVGHSRAILQLAAGQILNKAGHPVEGVAVLLRAINETLPGQPRTDLELAAAEILHETGKSSEAVHLLRAGLAVAPIGQPRSLVDQAINKMLNVESVEDDEVANLDGIVATKLGQEQQIGLGTPIPEVQRRAQVRPPSFFDGERIVKAMRPDGWFGLYVLGCYDHTKTVYVQQCRALTLIHALFETGELEAGRRLGIIGGGAAGITAAAAAAMKGADVVLFERSDNLMTLQRNNTKRFLHPHLYHWPVEGSIEPNAGLPVLNWKADFSNKVAENIVTSFGDIRRRSGKVELRLGRSIQDIGPVPSNQDTRRVQIIGAEGEIAEVVDAAIIAIGFGVEDRRPLNIETPAYWEDDGLNQALGGTPDNPLRILVSGAGDGALIDIMRASLRNFRHDEIAGFLPKGEALQRLETRLQEIELMAVRAALKSSFNFVNLHNEYNKLDLDQDMVDGIRGSIRRDTKVWFNFTSPGRYTTGSSLLNRFLVSVLCRLDAITPKLARLNEKSFAVNTAGKYVVTWPSSTESLVLDKVVVRHGASKNYLGSVFPELDDACAPLRGKLRELDLTASLHEATRSFFST
jgi:tetratricopeptide (TPR) repeat protein